MGIKLLAHEIRKSKYIFCGGIDVREVLLQCRREDSNLHSLNGNQVLNLARLPIPPLRQRNPASSRDRVS
jgi:hypothetical protein